MITFPNKPAPVIKHFLDQNKQLVYKYLLVKIKHAMKNNLDSVEVFQHNDRVESIKKQELSKNIRTCNRRVLQSRRLRTRRNWKEIT